MQITTNMVRWTVGPFLVLLASILTWEASVAPLLYRGLLGWITFAGIGTIATSELWRMLGGGGLWLPRAGAPLLWLAVVAFPQCSVIEWWLLGTLLLSAEALSRGTMALRGSALGHGMVVAMWGWLPLALALDLWTHTSPWLILTTIVVVKGADMAAFVVGRRWGSRLLSQEISPHKTWEGLGAALAFGLIAGLLFLPLSTNLSLAASAGAGLVLAAVGACGDLGESALKRSCQVKDSGALPGLGGALDMLDALLPAWVLVWICAR